MSAYSSGVLSGPAIRIVSILSLLTSVSPRKLGLVEICDRLSIAKSTGCLVLSELCASGYIIQQHDTLKYGLGLKPAMGFPEAQADDTSLPDPDGLLQVLYEETSLPMSLLRMSRRSAIVTNTIAPVSPLAQLGFRRQHLAPFGASFLVGASMEQVNHWIDEALRMEFVESSSVRRALLSRCARASNDGYEIVPQWEVELFQDMYPDWDSTVRDVFEIDSRFSAYRRKILHSRHLLRESGKSEDGGPQSISRVVIPLEPETACLPSTCLEVWLGGVSARASEIGGLVSDVLRHTMQITDRGTKP